MRHFAWLRFVVKFSMTLTKASLLCIFGFPCLCCSPAFVFILVVFSMFLFIFFCIIFFLLPFVMISHSHRTHRNSNFTFRTHTHFRNARTLAYTHTHTLTDTQLCLAKIFDCWTRIYNFCSCDFCYFYLNTL